MCALIVGYTQVHMPTFSGSYRMLHVDIELCPRNSRDSLQANNKTTHVSDDS